ncbi:uncharacterized protein B0I36DRAFT_364979 [Microdochium trichocladiopsis]|uniref:Uncharacterized protein n=1 Tax=Microdochium trichocladiopsis TaxID=1682393 RepID=A0A9P9BNK4_9PEZI|nr:uncharacterized protein B0I36DRAFT_364979 [Microdochium trichocladiopsis]KAH7027833.1 hypothetical protein B0I36DRAFT_364979 [Microdochium trichocladiopsis]
MLLKRKRSDSEFSCSSASTLSSPPRPETFFHKAPAHLNSRTLKRHRDNRPSEDKVYQHTLHLLYSAQQIHAAHQRSPSPSPQTHPPDQSSQQMPHSLHPLASAQRSLHNFWTLPGSSRARPTNMPSAPTTVLSFVASHPTSCADCGDDPSICSSMDTDGDLLLVDNTANGLAACSCCGKNVCRQCSITNLDEQRVCLSCTNMQQKNPCHIVRSRPFFLHG